MKKIFRRWWIMVIALVIALVFSWFYWPSVSFHLALYRMTFATTAMSAKSLCHLNTIEDAVTSSDIHNMYELGCARLDAIRGQYPRRTYKVTDEEGYCGVFSVVQFSKVHMCVGVFGGNDSDMVDVIVIPGMLSWPLPGYPAPKIEELFTDKLPDGIIRPW